MVLLKSFDFCGKTVEELHLGYKPVFTVHDDETAKKVSLLYIEKERDRFLTQICLCCRKFLLSIGIYTHAEGENKWFADCRHE